MHVQIVLKIDKIYHNDSQKFYIDRKKVVKNKRYLDIMTYITAKCLFCDQ